MNTPVSSKKYLSDMAVRNVRAWATNRPDMSGSQAIVDAIDELLERRREQWVLAEAIFQNVSADDAKHWARGIKVSLSGDADATPAITVETTAPKDEFSRRWMDCLRGYVPCTYGDAIQAGWIEHGNCEPHEWDNRTSAENARWMLEALIQFRDWAMPQITPQSSLKTPEQGPL